MNKNRTLGYFIKNYWDINWLQSKELVGGFNVLVFSISPIDCYLVLKAPTRHFISKALLEETSQIAEAWYKRVEFRLETWWYFHSPPLIRSPFSSELLVFHISKCCQACCQVSIISSLYPYHKTRRSWTCWTPLEVFIWLYHHLSSLVHVRFRPLIHIFVGTISISCLNPWFLGCIWTHVWESLQSLVTTYIYINNM